MKCSNDAHILLATSPEIFHPSIEIILGGNRNTFSAIKRSVTGESQKLVTKEYFYSSNMVSANDFKGFWLQWSNGVISCGREGEFKPFMSWEDANPFEVRTIGIYTGWGATGSWKIGRE